jgi:hypothetical protein
LCPGLHPGRSTRLRVSSGTARRALF